MLSTPHALAGAAVGAATGHPVAGLAAGIASHFVLDLVPHWNPKWPFNHREVAFIAVDVIVSFAVMYWLFKAGRPDAAWGAFGGVLPDIVLGGFFIGIHWLKGYYRVHAKYNWEVRPRYGVPTQLITMAIAIWLLS